MNVLRLSEEELERIRARIRGRVTTHAAPIKPKKSRPSMMGAGNPRWKGPEWQRNCQACNKEFRVKPSHAKIGEGKFCSSKCWRSTFPEKTRTNCAQCGKLIITHACQAHRAGKFCSRKCQSEFAIAKRPKLKCFSCGIEFTRKLSRYANAIGGGRFCSNACKAKYASSHVLTTSGRRRNVASGGKRADLDGMYFRSSWEANYARYLNWLKNNGQIKKWEFEPDTFEFNVKRGARFYTPDFKITKLDDSQEYHEVKGYFDNRSKTRMKRMRIYYPSVRLELIDGPIYYAIANKIGKSLPGWEVRTR